MENRSYIQYFRPRGVLFFLKIFLFSRRMMGSFSPFDLPHSDVSLFVLTLLDVTTVDALLSVLKPRILRRCPPLIYVSHPTKTHKPKIYWYICSKLLVVPLRGDVDG